MRIHPLGLHLAVALLLGSSMAMSSAQAQSARPLAADAQQADEATALPTVQQAQQNLAAAERALQQGRTPLPGERRGNVDGHSRLTPAYFDRLAALKQQVETAQQQLNEAYTAQRGLQ